MFRERPYLTEQCQVPSSMHTHVHLHSYTGTHGHTYVACRVIFRGLSLPPHSAFLPGPPSTDFTAHQPDDQAVVASEHGGTASVERWNAQALRSGSSCDVSSPWQDQRGGWRPCPSSRTSHSPLVFMGVFLEVTGSLCPRWLCQEGTVTRALCQPVSP